LTSSRQSGFLLIEKATNLPKQPIRATRRQLTSNNAAALYGLSNLRWMLKKWTHGKEECVYTSSYAHASDP
jgi:hypothetical protein